MTTSLNSTIVLLLGPVGAVTAAGRYDFPAEKRYKLLAYLACRGEWVSRERLAFLFWPDDVGESARANLRQLLQHLRRLPWLTDLEVERGRIRWAVETDLSAFWAAQEGGDLETALRLHRGPLLQDLEGYEDNEFASWLTAERERVHSAWRDALLRLCRTKPADKAAALYARLLEHDAFDEEALSLYVAALARTGRKNEALRVYRTFANRLGRELGIEPSSATRQLAEAIEKSEEPVHAVTREEPTTAVPAPAPSPLPSPATSFVGRDVELGEIAVRLTRLDCRLLTLLGPGGVGKTRLALQSARELAPRFPGGCHFVALDGLSDPGAIPAAIAGAVGLTLQTGDTPLDQVATFLGNDERLLVLDNFEHLVDGAPMLATLLERCPDLRLLATSRVRLDLDAEWLLPLGGLALPPTGTDTQDAEQYDAVRLFAERARRVQPAFTISHTDDQAVVKVCRLVEGSPLGIELAAAWARSLPVTEVAREIETNLDFLNSTSRNASERHRSVRATFEYSWRLLTKGEQDLLARLSVFRGGFTREAAAVVAGANLALLTALIDKSLLRSGNEGRYDFHPLVQQFGSEKLAGTEHTEETRAKHAEYFMALGETAEVELRGARQVAWLRRLDGEHDNLRGALRWCREAGLDVVGLRLAASLWSFWWIRGHWAEGRDWLATFLAYPDSTASQTRARALKAVGNLEEDLGNYEATQSAFEACLAAYRALEDEAGVATALYGLGNVSIARGDDEAAEAYFRETLAAERRLGNQLRVADSLSGLGLVYAARGDHAAARSVNEEGLVIVRRLDNRVKVVNFLNNLGVLAWQAGDLGIAADRLQESLAISVESSFEGVITLALSNLGMVALDQGDVPGALGYAREALERRIERRDREGLAYSLENIADVAASGGDPAGAARLWGAAEALRGELGTPLPPSWRPRRERFVDLARSRLDAAAFDAAWAEGRRMGLEEAVACAQEVGL